MATATAYEVIGARAFLAGIGADATDNMLIAVTAWFRQESGSLANVIGNNPFNIRPGSTSYLATGTRPGNFLIFPDIATGFQAAALLLKGAGNAYGYGAIVRAAQSGNAVNFLAAIALSSWDISHYGVITFPTAQLGPKSVSEGRAPAYTAGTYTGNAYTLQNHLLDVYSTFTGYMPPTAAQISSAKKGSAARGGASVGIAITGGTAPIKGVTAGTPGLAAAPGVAGPFASPQAAPNLAGVAAYANTYFDARETAKMYADRHHRSTPTTS